MNRIEDIFDAVQKLTSLPLIWKGIGSQCTDCGLDFRHTLHENDFCRRIKEDHVRLDLCCKHDNQILHALAKGKGRAFIASCHAGCDEIVFPFLQSGNGIEIVCAGPFRQAGSICAYPSLNEEFARLPQLDNGEASKIMAILDAMLPVLFEYKTRLQLAAQASRTNDPRVIFVINWLTQHIAEKPDLAALAKKIFLSSSRMSHIFKKEMNCSIFEYLMFLRIERAKSLLSERTLPLAEIMRQNGFRDQSRFCLIFKKMTGNTPLQYRKKFSKSPNA